MVAVETQELDGGLIEGDAALMAAATFMLCGAVFGILTQFCLLVRIFQQSIGWGLATLFIPFAGLVAIVMFWENTRRSFLGYMVCMGIMIAGYCMLPPALRVERASY